jgi:ABC-type multidrug transport system ATPase subunit
MRFRNLLSGLAADRVVILSTHIVSDVASAADRIAVMAGGRLLRHGAPEDLLRLAEGSVWEATVPSDDLPALRRQFLISGFTRTPDGVRVRLLLTGQQPLPRAEPVQPALDDAYLLLTSAPGGAPAPAGPTQAMTR